MGISVSAKQSNHSVETQHLQKSFAFLELPEDIINIVKRYLSSDDIIKLGQTCKILFHRLADPKRNIAFLIQASGECMFSPGMNAPRRTDEIIASKISSWHSAVYSLQLTAEMQAIPFVCSLDMTGMKCTEENMKALSLKFPNMRTIKAPAKISNEELKIIAEKFPHLESLDLSGCYRVSDEGLEHLKSIQGLKKLNLKGCYNVTDKGIEHIGSLISLEELNLSNLPNITNNCSKFLHKLLDLWSLDVTYSYRLDYNGHHDLLVNLPKIEQFKGQEFYNT